MINCPALSGLSLDDLSLKEHDSATIVLKAGNMPPGHISLKNCRRCPHHKGLDPSEKYVCCDRDGAIAKLPIVTN